MIIIFLLSSNNALYSQKDTQQVQDSIFDANTDILSVWKRGNDDYFPSRDPDNSLRYNQMVLDGSQRNYIDLIRGQASDQDKYKLNFQDTLIVDPMFMPLVFDGKIFSGDLIKTDSLKYGGNTYPVYSPLKTMNNPFEESKETVLLKRKAYLDAILADPAAVKYIESNMPKAVERTAPIEVNVFRDLFQVDASPDFSNVTGPERFSPKRKYWFLNGSSQLQLSYNDISDNWYKGGTGNFNLYSKQEISLNYKKNKIQNNNNVRWELSLYTNPDDKDRKTRTKIGTDLFRTYSDFGIMAFGDKWSYSSNLEIKTQLFDNYVDNPDVKTAALFSPLFVNVGILGMKYQSFKKFKSNKNKNLQINADISPLSVKYIYVRNPDVVDPSRYGIPDGKGHMTQFGSLVNSTLKFNIDKGISFSSRLKCFTDYEKLEFESENELNLAINRYFSTRVYFYLRFDDSENIVKGEWGYFQFNQLLSFGFNYHW